MKKSERILLVMTVCLVGFLLVSWQMDTKKIGGKGRPSLADDVPAFPPLPNIDGRYFVNYAHGSLDMEPIPSDLKDPFVLPVPEVEEEPVREIFKLTGLFLDDRKPAVLVTRILIEAGQKKESQKLLSVGESFGGWLVLSIEDNGTWISKESEKQFLKLHEKN